MKPQRASIPILALSLALVAWLGGCAGSQPPTRGLAQAHSSIRAAQEMGAQQHPRSALHLKLAKDQLKAAEARIASDEQQDASLLLERAKADAELALAYARTEHARTAAREAERKVGELRRR